MFEWFTEVWQQIVTAILSVILPVLKALGWYGMQEEETVQLIQPSAAIPPAVELAPMETAE